MRDFNNWFSTFTDSIYTYSYFTDFKKIYKNLSNIKVELNILNSLIGSQDIEKDFQNIIKKYPETTKCIPILLAIRQKEIIVNDNTDRHLINFTISKNTDIKLYIKFMQETGLFDLLSKSKIKSLQDYVTGIEVGLDTNSRKNRTVTVIENIIENNIKSAVNKKNDTYFKQKNTT